jgi:hypothetical protein
VLAPDHVADPTEHESAERTHDETRGERGQRRQKCRRRVVLRKEVLPLMTVANDPKM